MTGAYTYSLGKLTAKVPKVSHLMHVCWEVHSWSPIVRSRSPISIGQLRRKTRYTPGQQLSPHKYRQPILPAHLSTHVLTVYNREHSRQLVDPKRRKWFSQSRTSIPNSNNSIMLKSNSYPQNPNTQYGVGSREPEQINNDIITVGPTRMLVCVAQPKKWIDEDVVSRSG
jgi:hypothetical protein